PVPHVPSLHDALPTSQSVASHRVGGRVFARFENHRFRALAASDDEQRAVAASFAPSTVWAPDVIETGADGSVVVDLSGFLTRDADRKSTRLNSTHVKT